LPLDKAPLQASELPLVFLAERRELPAASGILRHLLTLDLLGGEPAWQVVHGLPFARAGVASPFGTANVSIAHITNTSVATPTTPLAIALRTCLLDCMVIHSFKMMFNRAITRECREDAARFPLDSY
jgi:hypothetical protein